MRSLEHLGAAADRDAVRLVGRLEDELYVSEPDHRPWGKRGLSLYALAVHERPVGRIQVHEHTNPFATLPLPMGRGYRRIRDHEIVVIGPPDVYDRRAHREALTGQDAVQHQEAR